MTALAAFAVKLLMLAAVASFVIDAERGRGKPAQAVDGFTPVDRRLMKG